MEEIMIVREDSTSYATTSLLTAVGMEDTCIGISRKSDSNKSVVHVDPTYYQASNETLIPVDADKFLVASTEIWAASAKTQDRQDYLIFVVYDETSGKTKGIFLSKESNPIIETSDIYQRCFSMFGYIPTFVKAKSADQFGTIQFHPDRFFSNTTDDSTIPANTVYFRIGRGLRTFPDSSISYAWILTKESTGESPVTVNNLSMVQVSWIDSSKFDAISSRVIEVSNSVTELSQDVANDIDALDERIETVEDTVSKLIDDTANYYVTR